MFLAIMHLINPTAEMYLEEKALDQLYQVSFRDREAGEQITLWSGKWEVRDIGVLLHPIVHLALTRS
jgi:hypothetical protein